MSRLNVSSGTPAPFFRDPHKRHDKVQYQRWLDGPPDESDSDSDSDSDDSDSDDSDSESASGYDNSTESSSGSGSSSVVSSSSRSSSANGKRSSKSTSSQASSSASSASSSSSRPSSSASTSSSSSSSSESSASTSSSTSSSSSSGEGFDRGGGGGIYRIEEEATTGVLGMVKRVRMKYAARRRHATLIKYEEQDVKAAEEKQMQHIESDRKRIREKRTALAQEVASQRQIEFFDRVRRDDMARYEAEVALHAKQAAKTQITMGLLEEWGLEADRRKADRDIQAAADDEDRRGAAAGEKLRARKSGEAAGTEKRRAEDEEHTQEILQLMRRSGTIAGVNAPSKEEPPEQRETNRHVILRCKPPRELEGVKRDRKFSLFVGVDLRKFKNVETMKGEAIGVEGAVFLSLMLRQGCCARLVHLNLGWNRCKKVGCDRLFDAFGKLGPSCLLETLDLRMNFAPASSVKKLCRHLRNSKALPFLKVLDLRQNVLGDDGVASLAHCVLANGVPELRRLYVNSNQATGVGVSALFKAFTAETVNCAKIEVVNCRDNVVPASTLRSFDPCPIFFQV